MMDKKRNYRQFCSVARALDVVGERWTLLIVRELLLGPRRYSELKKRLRGITTNLLASRLASMECHGLIQKQQQTSVGSAHVYELTSTGRKLEATVLALGQFGMQYMASGPNEDDQMDIGWGLLVLKLKYRGCASGTVTLHLNQENAHPPIVYQIKFSPEYVDIRHGQSWPTDVIATLSALNYRRIAFQGLPVSELENTAEIELEGNQNVWRKFLSSFDFRR